MTEAELLFSQILNCSRLGLYLNKKQKLDKKTSRFVASVLQERISGNPLPYILGKIEFMGLEFKVNRNVFIPRPETEILVETVLKIVCLFARLPVCPLKILDMGTGSGCIAVSLAKFIKDVKVTATDISREALKIAEDNAQLNNVSDKIRFIESNLFTGYELRITSYDVIVSNPPYIPSKEIDRLQSEVQYEPRIALDGGKDGLDFYRRIIKDTPQYLRKNAFLIMEMGLNQKEAIKNIFKNSGNFEIIKIVRDYNDIDRVVVAQLK